MACVCPQCEQPVPWVRRTFLSRRETWRCGNCNALIRWAKRAIWRDLVYFPVLILFYYAIWHHTLNWQIMAGIYVVFLAVLPWLERPEIVEYGRGACADCGYDIRGTPPDAEGVRVCPECAAMNVPRSSLTEKPLSQ